MKNRFFKSFMMSHPERVHSEKYSANVNYVGGIGLLQNN